jgi:glutamine amidotransferase
MISILDYGSGNIKSIQNMLKKIDAACNLISTATEVDEALALIIPGVGHIDTVMQRLQDLNLVNSLNCAAVVRKIPILGICVGMQVMTLGSDEGKLPGLGWLNARAVKLGVSDATLRVPHMGWNLINVTQANAYFETTAEFEQRFYFVHSFGIQCFDRTDVLATTSYGDEFVSAFARDNLIGVQFHPEKSHKFGEAFFRRFSEVVAISAAKHAH